MQEDFFINICTSHFIVSVWKGLLRVCMWEGVGDRTETAIFWPPLLWPSTVCLSRSPGLLNRRPTLLGDLLHLISNFSAPPTQSGAPSPFGLVWLSLPHLVYNSIRSPTATLWLLSWLSYIIVQHPLSRLLDLWNRMSSSGNNCHAVHRSLSSGASVYECTIGIFYLVPFHQPISAHAISSHTATRMCHLLLVHHLGLTFLAGSKVKNNKDTKQKENEESQSTCRKTKILTLYCQPG